jgi:hypothetical protein
MKPTIILFLFISAFKISAQNLVPNAGFESYLDCSTDSYLIDNAVNWKGMASADYFNSCIIPIGTFYTDVPINSYGFQIPYKGNAYAGITPFYGSDYKELIFVKLLDSLVQNKSYCISFKVNLADSAMWAVKQIGAYLTVDTIVPPFINIPTPPYYSFTYYTPQIESNVFLDNINDWTTINGIFVSQGGEKYINIGNFRDDASTDKLQVHNNSNYSFAYYYIDDISVEEVLNANAGTDAYLMQGDSVQLGNNPTENATYSWSPAIGLDDPNAANPKASPPSSLYYVLTKAQCNVVTTDTVLVDISVGMNEAERNKPIKIFPNPSDGNFILEANFQNYESGMLLIYDLTGKQVLSEQLSPGSKSISLSEELKAGMYQYNVMVNGKVVKRDKIVVIK